MQLRAPRSRLRNSTQARADSHLLDRVADPILIFDRGTHRILDCNAAMLRVYGLGSTFTVRVPVRPAGERAPAGERTIRGGELQAPCEPANAVRVLLVEDNPVNQRFVLRLLDRLGHRSDVAASSTSR